MKNTILVFSDSNHEELLKENYNIIHNSEICYIYNVCTESFDLVLIIDKIGNDISNCTKINFQINI